MRNITEHSRLTSPTRLSRLRRGRQKLQWKRKSSAAQLVCNPVRKLRASPPLASEQNGRKQSASSSRSLEQEWLHLHRGEYAGCWVALEGDQLVAHGSSLHQVLEAARTRGYDLPLVVHIASEPALPFGGW